MPRQKNSYPDGSIDALMTGLANAKRRAIVRTLLKGEVTVGTLASMFSLSQSAISQHLKKLRDIKIVTTRRDAQNIYYSCDHPDVVRLISVIDEIAHGTLEDVRSRSPK